MAGAKWEMDGEVAAFIVQGATAGRVDPVRILRSTTLNPFKDRSEVSEAMKKHLEGWERDKWRAAVRANHAGG
jgi:hypothetical protein